MSPCVARASHGVFDQSIRFGRGGDSMIADKLLFPVHTIKRKGVTMVKRIAVLAIVLAAFSILAVPALAANNGYRADYTTSDFCANCHQPGTQGAGPKVWNDWAATKHGVDAEGPSAVKSLPYGSVCAGCHSANFDPGKVTPVPTATTYGWNTSIPTPTATSTTISWGASPSAVSVPQTDPSANAPFSELDIGCSSCHYGAYVPPDGTAPNSGNDANDTAHSASYGKLANAEICGACHSRYSYTTGTYTTLPIPTTTATALIQPQMAIGYPMLGVNYQPLSNFLNVSQPGWSPTPNPAATTAGFGKLQTYWTVDGVGTKWQQTGHDGSAAQYPEWMSEGHANSLVDLKAAVGSNPPASCLKCHSADYRISVADGKPVPTGTEAQYGITCVGCHAPHKAGTAKGAWDEDFDAQLVGDPANSSDLCSTCHQSEIGDGVMAAGNTFYENQKEVMNGTGAIGVPQGLPGVHKGKCVECHMPPTSYSRGSAQLGGNHTFEIVTPKDAVDASPVPVTTTASTATPVPNGSPFASATPVVTTYVDEASMPYSACSTCHNKPTTELVPEPVATQTTDPGSSSKPVKVTITRVLQNQGDKALWLQGTIDQRQTAMHAAYNNVAAALHSAGLRMGYTGSSNDVTYVNALNSQLNTKGSAKWNSAELLWQDGYTDWTYVAAEGSWGVHNYQYDSLVINAALNYANQVNTTPQTVTLKVSKTSVKKNTKVTFSGTVKPATTGTMQIQKKSGSNWLNWKTASVGSSGSYSLKVKLTAKGTFYFRAFYKAVPPYAGGTSSQIKVVVKK
jgi:hypothetical protein